MSTIVGSTVTLEWAPGWAATGHTVTLEVTKPDGSTSSPTVSAGTDDGTFKVELTADQPGRYLLTWTDTDVDNIGVDIFDAWPADPRYLISVGDAASGLQWGVGDRATKLDTLALYVAAATEVIEDIVGAVLVRTIVQPADGGRTGVALWERPAAVTGVTVDGSPWPDYVVNLNAGIVYADKHGSQFPSGRQNVVITYRTGAETVAPSIQLAARELVRHLWQIGQQAPSGAAPANPQNNPAQMGQTRSGFAVPNRVIELCGNHYALPGTA